MYTILYVLGIAACAFLLIGSIVVYRRSSVKNTEVDESVSATTLKNPVMANPIVLLYVAIPVLTILIAMTIIFITQ